MKQLPYFKFYVNEWLSGDIELLSFEAQGVFIRLCSYYWSKECKMILDRSKKRFKGYEDAFQGLIDEGIIKVEGEFIKISFLDAQLSERETLSKTNSENGKKGGRPRKNPIESDEKPNGFDSESENKAKESNKEERREEEKRKENNYTAEADEIYSLYPSTCPIKGNSNGKTKKNKDKIKSILKSKEETVESLKAKIERYVRECKSSNTYMKNFGPFLNNLPDYSEEEKKEELKKDSPYDFWKDQLLNDPNTIFDGTFFYMEHTRKNTLDYSQYMELARLNDDKRKRQSHAK